MTVDSTSYTIKINKIIEPNVRLIRVQPNDLKVTLRYILVTLSSKCWISQITDILKQAYEVRVQSTIDKLNNNFANGTNLQIINDAGEYVVSELTRSSIVNELHYMDIPLGELFKQKATGNPGFDIFTVNLNEQILFGEAKYVANKNAYNNAFKQVNRFIAEKRDMTDLPDLIPFNINNAIDNASKGERGFIAGFSSTSISDATLEENIKNNDAYKVLLKDKEIICVAVDVR